MKTQTLQGQFILRCLDQRLPNPLNVDKKKILIGSSDKCDFQLTDKSISSVHAFLLTKGEGFMIKDLYSETGIFVNGTRVEESIVFPGDTLTIGTLSFVVEGLEEVVPVFNPDEAIKAIPRLIMLSSLQNKVLFLLMANTVIFNLMIHNLDR